ncbi:uncharacterized protein LOC123681437 [Harmonia axyridis]|uniref:uncharacterized protein LOC123681437 n=1 Tax=Harmonia axyridis TaxID=115357 RepID=UPI001E2775F5|nr:uncharacterized protein LOC123681437 [Harmonia axyridis]
MSPDEYSQMKNSHIERKKRTYFEISIICCVLSLFCLQIYSFYYLYDIDNKLNNDNILKNIAQPSEQSNIISNKRMKRTVNACCKDGYPGLPGYPGMKGEPGLPGLPGRDARKHIYSRFYNLFNLSSAIMCTQGESRLIRKDDLMPFHIPMLTLSAPL